MVSRTETKVGIRDKHLPQLLDELAKLSTPPPAQAQAA